MNLTPDTSRWRLALRKRILPAPWKDEGMRQPDDSVDGKAITFAKDQSEVMGR